MVNTAQLMEAQQAEGTLPFPGTNMRYGAIPVSDFTAWLNDPKRTEPLVYHTGMIAFDRVQKLFKGLKPEALTAAAISNAAMIAWERGIVELTQRRVAVNWFDYIATKRVKPAGDRSEFWAMARES